MFGRGGAYVTAWVDSFGDIIFDPIVFDYVIVSEDWRFGYTGLV